MEGWKDGRMEGWKDGRRKDGGMGDCGARGLRNRQLLDTKALRNGRHSNDLKGGVYSSTCDRKRRAQNNSPWGDEAYLCLLEGRVEKGPHSVAGLGERWWVCWRGEDAVSENTNS